MLAKKLTLSVLGQKFAICRLERNAPLPSWATKSKFFVITKTSEELSIVCPQKNVPQEVKAERNWRAFKVEGPLDLSLTGVLASLALPLAQNKINIFAISTYDTDYLLVQEEQFAKAKKILKSFCHLQS